ncbi:MAG: helix-turn-helix domain-containing protein [Myxococcales bacterium]
MSRYKHLPLDFGHALRTIRASRRITHRELAEAAGVDVSFVSLIETGRRRMSLQTLEAFARALDVPVVAIVLLATPKGALPKRMAEELAGLALDVTSAEEGVRA